MRATKRLVLAGLVASAAVVAVVAVAFGGSKPLVFEGLTPGLSLDAARQVHPAALERGASLYCTGDGDVAFEAEAGLNGGQIAQMACVWVKTDIWRQKAVVPLAIRDHVANDYRITFVPAGDGRWRLKSVRVNLPTSAYGDVVAAETEALGEPTELDRGNTYALVPGVGVQWQDKAGTLSILGDRGIFGGPVGTTVQLQSIAADKS